MIYDVEKLYYKELERIKQLDFRCCNVALVLASEDLASKRYLYYKEKLLKELQIPYKIFDVPNITQNELEDLLDNLSNRKDITAIMLELPINKNIDTFTVLEHIDYKKDLDGLTNSNLGRLLKNQETILPCTVKAVAKILQDAKIDLDGKNVVIVGRSILLGKPLQLYLTNKNATCTLCHSRTKNLKKITKTADILIVAIGKKHFITKEYINNNTFVIDVGTNYENKKVYGDVLLDDDDNRSILVTPVPKGVGLMTRICMLENILELKNKFQ